MNINRITSPINFKAMPVTFEDREKIIEAYKNKELVFFDVDTQKGFMKKYEKERKELYVDGSQGIKRNLGILTRLSAEFKIPKVETKDTHTPDDIEFEQFSAFSDGHCVKETDGWRKIPETSCPKAELQYNIDVNPKKNDGLSRAKIKKFIKNSGNITIEKNTYDLTKHANKKGEFQDNKKVIDILQGIKDAGVKIAVVYGVVTNICVQATVDALKKIGIRPIVVEDAVKEIGPNVLKDPNHKTFGDISMIKTYQLGFDFFSYKKMNAEKVSDKEASEANNTPA